MNQQMPQILFSNRDLFTLIIKVVVHFIHVRPSEVSAVRRKWWLAISVLQQH